MKYRDILFFLLFSVFFVSCATPRVAYLKDLDAGSATSVVHDLQIRIRAGDVLSILVNSKDPLLADLFNLPIVARQIGQSSRWSMAQGVSGYTVYPDGTIDFPVLGRVSVEGKSRSEVATTIKESLMGEHLVKDPVVTVEFMNLTVSVLGEVTRPGRFNIDKDRMTLLDVLSLAGDLTIFGRRDNVLVQREEGGKQVLYTVDLTSGASLYSSPVYYLQQNDVVYVEPNSMRARQSTVNGNNVRAASFWMSLASLLTTLAVLIVK